VNGPLGATTRKGDAQRVNEALAMVDRGAYLQAATVCNQLLKKHPKVPAIWGVLSAAQVGMAKHAEARKSAMKGLKLNPKSVELRIRLGLTYFADHRFEEAASEFERALKLNPGNDWAVRCLTDALTKMDRDEEAYELLREQIAKKGGDAGLGLALLKVCDKTKRYEEGLRIAEPLLAERESHPRFRAVLLFKIAELYAKSGNHDRAFEVYRMANEAPGHRFDAERHRAGIDRVIEAWTPEAFAGLERPQRRSVRFVFVLGMPRSGTSLVEQIISSHPRAHGCGELDFINNIACQLSGSRDGWAYINRLERLTKSALDQGAQKYAQELRKMAPGAERVTDKMPSNALQLGLISAMLPECRVIHCVRDARDTCLSCYFHHFLGKGNVFTYDLENLGDCYSDYWRLMKQWKSGVDVPVLDVRYEEMIADQEGQSRRLIDFLGLDWDDRCLSYHEVKRTVKTLSHDQVSKPIYTSSMGRWKPYEKHLGPLLERLPEDAMLPDGYAGAR